MGIGVCWIRKKPNSCLTHAILLLLCCLLDIKRSHLVLTGGQSTITSSSLSGEESMKPLHNREKYFLNRNIRIFMLYLSICLLDLGFSSKEWSWKRTSKLVQKFSSQPSLPPHFPERKAWSPSHNLENIFWNLIQIFVSREKKINVFKF